MNCMIILGSWGQFIHVTHLPKNKPKLYLPQVFNFTELAQMYRVADNLSLAIQELGLILVDINLLKISGLQITRQNERNGMLGHILVIPVTAFVMKLRPTPNVRAAMRVNAEAYLHLRVSGYLDLF